MSKTEACRVELNALYQGRDGVCCRPIRFTVDPQDCVALVRYQQLGGLEEIVSIDEFLEAFPSRLADGSTH